jgi:Uma2 family endonuclease
MTSTALKRATLEDLLALGEDARAELIDGRIVPKARPSGEHSDVESAIDTEIRKRFRRNKSPGGFGGWWIKTEVSVLYPQLERVFCHDIAGWNRDRVPENPKGYPVRERPDWVCEVCWTTWRKDTVDVPETLALAGVPHYWVADVERECLLVFRLVGDKYALIQNLFRTETKARIEPFEAAELNVDVFFGADAED